jgi:AraC family transcriptional regulator
LGKIATNILAKGNGWEAADVICTSGPQDRPFEEQHHSISIAVVLEGSFQYRSAHGSEVMSPGSLLLGNFGQSYECGHEHAIGDRCMAFYYTPDFFEHAHLTVGFPIHRIPPIRDLARWIVKARLGLRTPDMIIFEELAFGLADSAVRLLEGNVDAGRTPTAADERRVSAALRFIEANLAEALTLDLLASSARMSQFHFVRVFKQVTGVTPHQYILRSRLREAALRLRTTPDDVVIAAMDAGFRDLSNFNHVFRAEFGVNPTLFRERFGRNGV